MVTPDQQNLHHYISGCSYTSLVAPTEDLFYQTVTYYTDFGFTETRVFDRQNHDSDPTGDICKSSEKETWLYTEGEDSSGGTAFTIKVRYVVDAKEWKDGFGKQRRDSTIDPPTDWKDWRASKQSTVLYSSQLRSVVDNLKSKGYAYQTFPNDIDPVEVFTHDPLGTLVGFTSKVNPYTTASKPVSAVSHNNEVDSQSPATLDKTGKKRKIAVMTSGGDSPGMNGAVRAVVRMAIHSGCEAFAIHEGYEGLVKGGDFIRKMDWEGVRGYLSEGGTLIGTARCMEFIERKGRLAAAKNMVLNGIDALIICGGDGSLTGADVFRSEWPGLLEELVATKQLIKEQILPYQHLNIAGLVGSIDNDMSSTDATIGAYSSLHRICQMVDYIDATAASHSRAFVIEVMGRHCGWLALMAGVSTGADFIFIPEKPAGMNWESEMCSIISKHRSLGKRKTIIIVAEGATDEDLNHISAHQIKESLEKHLKLDTRVSTLGHVQRGGPACAYDRILSTLQGVEAVKAVLESGPDTPSYMIAIDENKIIRKPLMKAVELTKAVTAALHSKDFKKAMSLRDAEFEEYYNAFMATTSAENEGTKLAEDNRLNIAIIHVGAPAGGINAATRAAALYCLSRGHRPYAIHNGFPGLVRHDSVRPLTWLGVEGWAIRGGSEIGTNRTEPNVDMGMVAWYFQKYNFHGLLMIGGFEAFKSLSELRKARDSYPAFRIPMICLPATISNNVPGTEYSVGSDTCLNSLIEYCDAIKQSASASRRRVFVVECQGGRSGYVATMAGLSTGALAVYTPEEGINIGTLKKDIDHLRESFAVDQGMNRAGKLILRNEKASSCFTTEIIAGIIREEAKGRFEARTSVPGHVQQGGTPSPMDRVRAVRLALRCMAFIEQNQAEEKRNDPDVCAVIGIQGAGVVFTPMRQLEDNETDWENRRPLKASWQDLRGIVDILSGREAYLTGKTK